MTAVAISRGDIFLVDLGKTVGAETYKTRPCVIIQNDVGNVHSPVTIVAIITSYKGKKLYPVDVFITASETGLDSDSVVKLDQIRTVDKNRLIKKLGRIPNRKMKRVDMALIRSLDLDYT